MALIKKSPIQLSLFDYISRQRAGKKPLKNGRYRVGDPLRTAMADAISESGKSRETIADEMAGMLDTRITKFMVDAWTAESKGGHRIPAEYLPAFCRAVGSNEPMMILVRPVDLFALPAPDALRAEVEDMRQQRLRLSREIRKRETLVAQLMPGEGTI